jgi:DNA (cytosine-5)-methyltransferase 1
MIPVIAFHATQDPISGSISPALGSNMYAGVAQPMCFQQNTRDEVRYINGDGQIAGALAAEAGMKQQNYVAQPIAFHATQDPINGPISPALGSNMYAGVQQHMAVRRLTPVECERLQGFPDNYTAIPWRGKTETPDGPRYKALGNSMAVPVMKWIGENIREVDNA